MLEQADHINHFEATMEGLIVLSDPEQTHPTLVTLVRLNENGVYCNQNLINKQY